MKRSFYYSWAQLTRVPPLHSLCSVVLLCLQSWTRKQALTDEASILWDMHELCLLSCTLSAFPQVCFHILCTRTFELKDWNCTCAFAFCNILSFYKACVKCGTHKSHNPNLVTENAACGFFCQNLRKVGRVGRCRNNNFQCQNNVASTALKFIGSW